MSAFIRSSSFGMFIISLKEIERLRKGLKYFKNYFLLPVHMCLVYIEISTNISHMEASISSEFTADPFGASSVAKLGRSIINGRIKLSNLLSQYFAGFLLSSNQIAQEISVPIVNET
ncbi:hypothetical protein L1049_025112 [Liquidambar formosana]|uniref:Uncharacterized protein n=1 Tax=Liquidambar formosana TaxID=63359 RepID=A0AAP0X1Q8_LIQFO